MTPDDSRHGQYAGYVAGCRCADCGLANYRGNKEREMYRLAHGSCRIDASTASEVVAPWLRMGYTLSAIFEAAGLNGNTGSLHTRWKAGTDINRGTYTALAALTEDSFPGTTKIPSDLTKRRVFSLMVAGHPLKIIPITYSGHWRTRDLVSLDVARAVRGFYRANEFKLGPSRHTAARARNAGHLPPMAWDDPGTLAWPDGAAPKINTRAVRPLKTDVDPVVVQRVLAGDRLPMTSAERLAVVNRAQALGWSESEISERTGIAKATDKTRFGTHLPACGCRPGTVKNGWVELRAPGCVEAELRQAA